MKRCSQELQAEGRPYPRTCAVCGLGPCKGPSLPSDPIHDLADAILRLQHVFRRQRIEPAIITLSSWEDGQRLAQIALRSQSMNNYDRQRVAMDEQGNPVNQIEIAGTIVRWPALPLAVRGGGFRFT